ncbi:ABC transporter ATP-binding protein [Streptosporangium sp. NPDC006007]|uniref:ABC transporter ATP-binding protein n=1 Tax=Streptosporangium sp. NPDC006007 TaxID=3154575 RepID=UPI0033B6947F
MSDLEITGLTKRYGTESALDDVTFTVSDGELVTVLGHSGSGKTTLLRSVAGFIEPTSGDVRVNGNSLLDLPINRRGIGIVFQNYALFPHMTVRQNVGYGLRVRRIRKDEVRERVDRELERVQLSKYADRKPAQLSGGQQQRVALARALVLEPSIVLFDEPFSNLDAMLRDGLRRDLRQLQRRLGFTALFVTHDQREAMALADRVAVMRSGRLVQYGPPQEIYNRPSQVEVAALLGRSNLLRCLVKERDAMPVLEWCGQPLIADDSIPAHAREVTAFIRPENLVIEPPVEGATSRPNVITGRVVSTDYFGSASLITVETENNEPILVEARHNALSDQDVSVGAQVTVRIPKEAIRILD